MQRMPVLLAGALFLPDETARIAAALSVAELAGFPIMAVVAALNPELAARKRAGGDVSALARTHRASIALGLAGGIAAAVVLAVLGPFVLSWFAVGAEHAVLLVFVFAHVLRSAFGVSTQVLLVCGHVRLVWAGNLIGLATAYGAGIAIGPEFGPSGLGAALVFGTLVSQAFLLGAVLTCLGPRYRAAFLERGTQ
jgi:O-antigen/teichoic acid export membrane protein